MTPAVTHSTREQRAALWFVATVGTLSLFFGGAYLWRHMARPFAINYVGPRFLLGSEQEARDIAAARAADTDSDTVSDYDEREIYGTNPYLADTDGDGADDATEITAGGDPLCAPDDTRCRAEDIDAARPTTVDAGAFTEGAAQASEGLTNAQQILQEISSATPAQVRAMLKDSGATDEELAAMSDEEVMALYSSALAQFSESGGWNAMLQTEGGEPATP